MKYTSADVEQGAALLARHSASVRARRRSAVGAAAPSFIGRRARFRSRTPRTTAAT